jgi:tetratricopeptide (TPR) repeat protein
VDIAQHGQYSKGPRRTSGGRHGSHPFERKDLLPEATGPFVTVRSRSIVCVGAIVVTAWLIGCAGRAPNELTHHDAHSLGIVDFPISCSAPAQAEFNHALALLHHMTYPQARDGFQRVATTDSTCAMAQWGIAMTLFQPLWPTRPRPKELQRGWDAVQSAKALHPPTQRERLFVAAAEAFYLEPTSLDYWLRIRRWEHASKIAHDSLPNDDEAAVFYALALLATAPSDTMSRAHADRAAEILLRVYDRNPNHPGAMHYLVHANDVPGRERESLEITRKYELAAPSNAHALHMPTHIYTRLGDWNGVIRGNLRAADAAFASPAGEHDELISDEFPHAIEYLVYAYLQEGADDEAAAQIRRLRSTANIEPTFKLAFHLASTQARFALERHEWGEAAMVVPREPASIDWDRFAWAEAVSQFARGLGAAHQGDVTVARVASERLGVLEAATVKGGEAQFARNIRVLRLELNAWQAHMAGHRDSSVALMREAADLEASTPKHAVTPGPTLPAQELLGDLLMEQRQPAEALASYQHSMVLYPRRFNGLLGAARAARATDDSSLARGYYKELLEVAAAGTRQAPLAEARNYVAAQSSAPSPSNCASTILRCVPLLFTRERQWSSIYRAASRSSSARRTRCARCSSRSPPRGPTRRKARTRGARTSSSVTSSTASVRTGSRVRRSSSRRARIAASRPSIASLSSAKVVESRSPTYSTNSRDCARIAWRRSPRGA